MSKMTDQGSITTLPEPEDGRRRRAGGYHLRHAQRVYRPGNHGLYRHRLCVAVHDHLEHGASADAANPHTARRLREYGSIKRRRRDRERVNVRSVAHRDGRETDAYGRHGVTTA